jgi:hypothetical protein
MTIALMLFASFCFLVGMAKWLGAALLWWLCDYGGHIYLRNGWTTNITGHGCPSPSFQEYRRRLAAAPAEEKE